LLLDNPILGDFPDKTICLTYDDGPGENGWQTSAPGPHSLELARYLASQGVLVTFFMVGRHLQQHPGIASEISALGHQVGVHTYDHVHLPNYFKEGGDVVRQMALTGALMPKNIDFPHYFRPPFGVWSQEVASAMNADFLVRASSFGPINWNCDGGDWEDWRDGNDPILAADKYEAGIDTRGNGIVLMHDSCADLGHIRDKNRALALTRILVPRLKEKGYRMMRLDSIADIASTASMPMMIALRSVAHKSYLSCQAGVGGQITFTGLDHGDSEKLTAVALGSNRFAFAAPSGKYLSVQQPPNKSVSATADKIGDWEIFDVMPFPEGKIAFRVFSGGFLTVGNGEPPELELQGSSGSPADRSIFTFFSFNN
jgi:peptidoglycan/xylan/chitin deacetylase (PgdA/CDA1 family)